MTDLTTKLGNAGLEALAGAPAADIDLAPPHAPGEPGHLHRGRIDELDHRPSRARR